MVAEKNEKKKGNAQYGGAHCITITVIPMTSAAPLINRPALD